MAGIRGNRVINGSKGQLWKDGSLWAEVIKVELKAKINRDKVMFAGSIDEDSKVTTISCDGSFTINKVYTRESEFIEAMQDGTDDRFQLFITLDDPDAYGRESVKMENCWFNEITVAQFEAGKVLEREFPFGCTFTDISYPETISL